MCVNYLAVQDDRRYEAAFGVQLPLGPWAWELYPKSRGTFIRRRSDAVSLEREATGGTWGLLPWFAKTPEIKFNTVNARADTAETTASYKAPWARGQRCIVPMEALFELNWETGKHIRWKFSRRDGAPIGVAGLWERWRGKGAEHEVISYALLTVNADDHPVMRRMHKPGQEKRMLTLLDPAEYDEWLERPAGAFELLRPYLPELLVDEPAPRPPAEPRSAPDEMGEATFEI